MLLLLASLAVVLQQPSQREEILSRMECNGQFWQEVFSIYSGETLGCADYIFMSSNPSHRESMTLKILEDHIFGALEARDMLWDSLPDSVFLPYLLEPRIYCEPLIPYRSMLCRWWSSHAEDVVPEDLPLFIHDFITESLSVSAASPEHLNSGIMYILTSEEGSSQDLWIFTGASLRAHGIPVRPVQGLFKDSVELTLWHDYWTDSGWQVPIDTEGLMLALEQPIALNVTGRYVPTGLLQTMPLGDFQQGNWEASLFQAGFDTLKMSAVQINPFFTEEIELGQGQYLVEVSYTHEDGRVDSWQQAFGIEPNSVTIVMLSDAIYQITPLPAP